MKALASLEVHYILKELSFLIGAKVDKIYNPDKKTLLLQLHVSNQGKRILKITEKSFYLTDVKEEQTSPSGFCMFLRNHLDNSRLKKIIQLKSERIIELEFETKEGIKKLIIELFGGGNLILTDKDNKIISALEFHKFKDREIKKDVSYKFPEKEFNFFKLKNDDFKEMIENSNKKELVKLLAVDLGFGGVYSEEICLISGVDKNKNPSELDNKETESILKAVKKIINKKPEPQVVYEKEKIKDVIPVSLDIYKNNDKKDFKTFSEAIEFCDSSDVKKETKYDKKVEKINKIIDKQKTKIAELKKAEKENREKGELIYGKYQLIREILTEIDKAKEKYSWDEIKKRLKGHKMIKEVDTKDKKIIVEI